MRTAHLRRTSPRSRWFAIEFDLAGYVRLKPMSTSVRTTSVGSYPVLSWPAGNTSRLVLPDALMVVLKAQGLAGPDVVTDGELLRFDPNNPETNGMVFTSFRGWMASESISGTMEASRYSGASGVPSSRF